MHSNTVETLVGAFVLSIALFILGYAYFYNDTSPTDGVIITADFERVDGLNVGNDVRMGGIKVGKVVRQAIDPQSYMARITFSIDPNTPIPADSSASIASESLLGGKYLDLRPGGSDTSLNDGDHIEHTQSSVNLESLIGKMIFNKDEGSSAT